MPIENDGKRDMSSHTEPLPHDIPASGGSAHAVAEKDSEDYEYSDYSDYSEYSEYSDNSDYSEYSDYSDNYDLSDNYYSYFFDNSILLQIYIKSWNYVPLDIKLQSLANARLCNFEIATKISILDY